MQKSTTQIMSSTDKYTRKITPVLSSSNRILTNRNFTDKSTSPARNHQINNKPVNKERPGLEQKSPVARKGSPLSMLSSSQLNPRKSVLERSTVLHNDDDITQSAEDDSKKLNRYMFYEDDFSLSKYFLDSSRDCEEHEKSAISKRVEKRDCSPIEKSATPELTTPKGDRHMMRAQGIKNKISKIAIPSCTDSQFKPKTSNNGAISERSAHSKSPKVAWISPKNIQKNEYKLESSYKVSPKASPTSNHTKMRADTSCGSQKPGELSQRDGSKSNRSPLVEPGSPKYGKFSILFRDIGDKSKALDPKKYQKMKRAADAYDMHMFKENPAVTKSSTNPYVKNYLESKRKSDAFTLRE